MHTESAISPLDLQQRLGEFPPPTVVDVRRSAVFAREPEVIAGAIRRDPEDLAHWAGELERWRPVIVYCVHGHEVSQQAMAAARRAGFDAAHLVGGVHAWREHGGTIAPPAPPSRWVTRARPKIDRIACPWLVRRFIDPTAEFFYVPGADVAAFAAANGATPCDVPGDHAMLRAGMLVYDALYAGCRQARAGNHGPASKPVQFATKA